MLRVSGVGTASIRNVNTGGRIRNDYVSDSRSYLVFIYYAIGFLYFIIVYQVINMTGSAQQNGAIG